MLGLAFFSSAQVISSCFVRKSASSKHVGRVAATKEEVGPIGHLLQDQQLTFGRTLCCVKVESLKSSWICFGDLDLPETVNVR